MLTTSTIRYRSRIRQGVTLLELLIAMGIMALLIGALGTMADAVYKSAEHSQGYGLAAQHARVVMDRIKSNVSEATANEDFPGVLVLSTTLSGWRFPDRLVIWHPDISAADPNGVPQVQELIIYCPNPDSPNELYEITVDSDTSDVPAATDSDAWNTLINTLLESSAATRVVLTDLLSTGTVTEAGSARGATRGKVRFEVVVRPSATEWTNYQGSSLAWDSLSWPQSIYGSETGLRQTWLRYELILSPGEIAANSEATMPALPFFGSAALYYQMNK